MDRRAGKVLDRGNYAEAERLYKMALGRKERALGPDDPAVAVSMDNLANLYQVQGRDAEVEPLYLRALEIRVKALGLDHPDVAVTLNKLVRSTQPKINRNRSQRSTHAHKRYGTRPKSLSQSMSPLRL